MKKNCFLGASELSRALHGKTHNLNPNHNPNRNIKPMQKITHADTTVALILNDTLIIDESAFNKLEAGTPTSTS